MALYERKYGDLTLRLTGVLLLSLAVLIGRHLFAVPDVTGKVRLSAYLLALIGMASACAGAALAVLGRHLFDQVELPARWTIHLPERQASAELGARDPR
jgi:hypothetical protein